MKNPSPQIRILDSDSFKKLYVFYFADAKTVAKAYDCKYTETSGALNHNVDELLSAFLNKSD